jgi:hypothetical protein
MLMTGSGLSGLTVRQLRARRRRLAGGLADVEATLHGVLLSKGRRCSSEGCRCRRGELHGPYWYLAIYADGRSRTIYVPSAIEAAVAERVDLTQRNEARLGEISLINLELLKRRALE